MTNEQVDCLLLITQFWRRAIEESNPNQFVIADVLRDMLNAHLAKVTLAKKRSESDREDVAESNHRIGQREPGDDSVQSKELAIPFGGTESGAHRPFGGSRLGGASPHQQANGQAD